MRTRRKLAAILAPPIKTPAKPAAKSAAPAPSQSAMNDALYEKVYEHHARELPQTSSIGGGDYDVIGALELAFLKRAGLREASTLLDFGCGTGRLAIHAVPYLKAGTYLGSDIAPSMLAGADQRLKQVCPTASCKITLLKQKLGGFDLPSASVDMICAYSVFTHMEHEDAYQYLVDGLRIVRPGGKFVFSCLPLSIPNGRQVFHASAASSFGERWSRVRDVATTMDMMDHISSMAGWRIEAWYPGDAPHVSIPSGESHALGQSVCVLVKS